MPPPVATVPTSWRPSRFGLASLSKFVIVDIANPRSAPLELQATVPDYLVPFSPILQQGEQPFSMFWPQTGCCWHRGLSKDGRILLRLWYGKRIHLDVRIGQINRW